MDYGKTISRAVTIVWEYKFLILLGILASLGSGSGASSFNGSSGGSGSDQPFMEPGQMPELVEPGQFPEFGGEVAGLAVGLVLAIACVALFIGLALWVVSSVARGGLIAAVEGIENGTKMGFSKAWGAGWQKLWTLLGIGLLPAIPALLLFIVGVLVAGAYSGLFALFGETLVLPAGTAGLTVGLVLIVCIAIPIVLALTILRVFAERACMLEDLGVVDAYRRGYEVLTANMGEAIMLYLLQIGISIVLGILLFLPGIFLLICFCLWPLLLALQGAISAAISALWTLAWREWTGKPPIIEKAPAAF